MWVFSRAGFFSAVEKGNKKGQEVCVRARVLEDFDRLRKLYYPEMGTVERSYNTDYPYRIYVSHDAWARVMAAMSKDINYANFKGMVAKEQGEERVRRAYAGQAALSYTILRPGAFPTPCTERSARAHTHTHTHT